MEIHQTNQPTNKPQEVPVIKVDDSQYLVGFMTIFRTETCWSICFGKEEWATRWDLASALEKAQSCNRDIVSYYTPKSPKKVAQ